MGDRPRSSSRLHTSEDKVCRKDWCWSVRADYVLEKLQDVSELGLVEAGRYTGHTTKASKLIRAETLTMNNAHTYKDLGAPSLSRSFVTPTANETKSW